MSFNFVVICVKIAKLGKLLHYKTYYVPVNVLGKNNCLELVVLNQFLFRYLQYEVPDLAATFGRKIQNSKSDNLIVLFAQRKLERCFQKHENFN